MGQVFGSIYAGEYDQLYDDKDYASECDLIERIFKSYGTRTFKSILDLGCGTGNHALCLAQRGYEVVGIDHSAHMLTHAQRKVTEMHEKYDLSFQQGDLRTLDLDRRFDAVLMMFTVLGYQLTNTDVLSTLDTAYRHLHAGGALIFDFWYGPAVLHLRPSQEIKVVSIPDGKILRVASGELDVRKHLCTVRYHLWRLLGDRLVAETEESHQVRYFFPLELDLFLERSGLTLVHLGAFPDIDRNPDEKTWNTVCVARAI
jgi:SAM-dependent methyltransferase